MPVNVQASLFLAVAVCVPGAIFLQGALDEWLGLNYWEKAGYKPGESLRWILSQNTSRCTTSFTFSFTTALPACRGELLET